MKMFYMLFLGWEKAAHNNRHTSPPRTSPETATVKHEEHENSTNTARRSEIQNLLAGNNADLCTTMLRLKCETKSSKCTFGQKKKLSRQ